VGHNRVARLRRENDLGVPPKRRFRVTTSWREGDKVAENLLARCFDLAAAKCVWVSDITYVATAEGWMYLCVVLDLNSRRVVGWSMSERIDTVLVQEGLWMACLRPRPARGVIFHSDRGT